MDGARDQLVWFRGERAARPRRRACWRRLAVTVAGIGALVALLLLAVLAVGVVLLPLPVLLVPVTAAAAAVVYVTGRGRGADGTAPRPWSRSLGSARHRRVPVTREPVLQVAVPQVAVPQPRRPEPRRQEPAWPTGRRRRGVVGPVRSGSAFAP